MAIMQLEAEEDGDENDYFLDLKQRRTKKKKSNIGIVLAALLFCCCCPYYIYLRATG